MLALEDVSAGPLTGLTLALAPGQSARITLTSLDAKERLFGLLAGHQPPDKGRVRLFGQDLHALPEAERLRLYRRVGIVPEQGGLISNLKVWENILLPAGYHQGLDAATADRRVVSLWREIDPEAADLRLLMGQLPSALSLAERRRVALVRALLPEPELLVYDFLSSGVEAGAAATWYALTQRFQGARPGRVSVYLCPDDRVSETIRTDVSLRIG